MTEHSFIFTVENKNKWPEMRNCIKVLQQALMITKKGLKLTISEIKADKSHRQLRGFHRLIDLIVPYFNEWDSHIWDRGDVKDFIKTRYGFCKSIKGINVVKSCKYATKEEMMGLIEETIKFAAEMDIPDVLLNEDEARDLDEFYINYNKNNNE